MEVDGIIQAVASATWFESLAVALRPLQRRLAETKLIPLIVTRPRRADRSGNKCGQRSTRDFRNQ
jgi:hypothetical protein